MIQEDTVVFLGSPVGGYAVYPGTKYEINSAARFRVWKTYHGQTKDYENIDLSSGTSCQTAYPFNRTSIIVAYRNSENELQTGYCTANAFTRQELLNYFANGIDTLSRDYCYIQIKYAYDVAALSDDEFKVENPECLQHKQSYDARFRINTDED